MKLTHILAVALTALAGSMATATQYDSFQRNPLVNEYQPVSHSWAYAEAISPHGEQWMCYAQGVAEWDCFKPKNNSYGVKTSEKHRADERNFWGIDLTSTRFQYGNSWVGGADAYNNSLPGYLWHKTTSAIGDFANTINELRGDPHNVGFFGSVREGLRSTWNSVISSDSSNPLKADWNTWGHDEQKRNLTDPNTKDVDHIRLPTKWAVKGEYHSWYKYHTLNYVDPEGSANSFNLLAGGEWKFCLRITMRFHI